MEKKGVYMTREYLSKDLSKNKQCWYLVYVSFPTHRTINESPWDGTPIFSKNKGEVHTPGTEWTRGKLVEDELREVLREDFTWALWV